MKSWTARMWPTLLTLGAGAVAFLSPSVQAYAGAHPSLSVPILTVWGIALHWATSPKDTPKS
jgi:hypothetical protein